MTRFITCLLTTLGAIAVSVPTAKNASLTAGITAIEGVKVGHHTLSERPTGCTIILTESGATAAVDVRGSAPGTREIALLDPTNTVNQVHAITLAGGSAFGLSVADGVMRYLEERNIGYDTGSARVPIVPAAILYDLNVGPELKKRPTATCGYEAAQNATDDRIEEGSVGAGAGATVGKLGGPQRAMKGGIGTSLIEIPGGIKVAALMAVNALGDIVNPDTGTIIAGVRTLDGKGFADASTLLRRNLSRRQNHENTTIGVVATNATLNKSQLGLIARMAHDGMARSVRPSHTPSDGDIIFAIATGHIQGETNLLQIGSLAAEVTAEAIIRGVSTANSIPGYPSVRDFQGGVH